MAVKQEAQRSRLQTAALIIVAGLSYAVLQFTDSLLDIDKQTETFSRSGDLLVIPEVEAELFACRSDPFTAAGIVRDGCQRIPPTARDGRLALPLSRPELNFLHDSAATHVVWQINAADGSAVRRFLQSHLNRDHRGVNLAIPRMRQIRSTLEIQSGDVSFFLHSEGHGANVSFGFPAGIEAERGLQLRIVTRLIEGNFGPIDRPIVLATAVATQHYLSGFLYRAFRSLLPTIFLVVATFVVAASSFSINHTRFMLPLLVYLGASVIFSAIGVATSFHPDASATAQTLARGAFLVAGSAAVVCYCRFLGAISRQKGWRYLSWYSGLVVLASGAACLFAAPKTSALYRLGAEDFGPCVSAINAVLALAVIGSAIPAVAARLQNQPEPFESTGRSMPLRAVLLMVLGSALLDGTLGVANIVLAQMGNSKTHPFALTSLPIVLLIAAVFFAIGRIGSDLLASVAREETLRRERAAIFQERQKDAALAALGTMTAAISHEGNNRLNGVLAALGNALARLQRSELPFDPRIEESLRKSMQRLEETGDILADVGKVVRPNKDPDTIPLAQFVHDEVEDFARHRIRAEYDVDIADNIYVLFPRLNLGGIFSNLIKNALDAFEAGNTVAPRIEIAARAERDLVTVTVADNGPGMADSVRSKAFEQFITTKELGKGVGLGLHIVHDFVRRGGGTIRFETGTGAGTRFILVLPRAEGLHHGRNAS